MTTHLVTFASNDMSRSAELCEASGLAHGVNFVDHWPHTAFIKQHFYNQHEALLSQPRGLGFWAWKPFIVSKALQMRSEGDILIYSDVGVEFLNNVNYIIDRMEQEVFLFGNMYEHAHWCKRDVVEEVWAQGSGSNIALGSELDHQLTWMPFGKQVQASVIFFRVSDYSRAFVKEWLDWCLFEGGRLIDDSPSRTPNHPEFKENRHDQAILTTMAYREGLRLHYWPASYNDGAFTYPLGDYPDEQIPILFNHHRRRNHEWSNAA